MKRRPHFKFRLYISGQAQNSAQAVANLRAICRSYLPNGHETEVVDVFKEPGRAFADGILMTPTLIKLAPGDVTRIVGNLSDTQTIVDALGLELQAT